MNGKPCWFELMVTDPHSVESFYAALFGWSFQPGEGKTDTATLGGRAVAAITAGRPIGRRSVWMVYLAADDLAALVRSVTAAGGAVIKPPRKVPGGYSAVVADPTGGYVGLWQAGTFLGSEVVDEPGAFCWTEVSSKDPSAAGAFFSEVFGMEIKRPFPGYSYAQLRLDGRQVAGLLGMIHERRPYTGPAAWLIYFQVTDTDRAVDLVLRHGGTVIVAAENTQFGRLAVLADPLGARFAVITRTALEQP